MATFEKDDLEAALNQLIELLVERKIPATIRLVGGAALSLAYFDRSATVDVDAVLHPAEPIKQAAAAIAARNGWPDDWLNDRAVAFLSHYDTADDWRILRELDGVTVFVASAELLLAMKLLAARGPRDYTDLDELLVICGVSTLAEAETIFERYYPDEILKPRAMRYLEARYP